MIIHIIMTHLFVTLMTVYIQAVVSSKVTLRSDDVWLHESFNMTCSFASDQDIMFSRWDSSLFSSSTIVLFKTKDENKCTTIGDLQPPEYSFDCSVKNEFTILVRQARNTHHLTEWKCYYGNNISNTVTLKVNIQVNSLTLKYEGGVIIEKEIINVKEKSVLTAECMPSFSRPLPDIEWYKYLNGSTLSGDKILIGDVKESDRAVLHYNTSRNDNGASIGCVASNKGNSNVTSETMSLNILYAPGIDEMKNCSAVEGSSFSIICPVIAGNPSSQALQWKRIDGNYTMATAPILSISNVSRDDNMAYICILTYKMKPTGGDIEVQEVQKHFYLTVFYKAVITTFSSTDLQTDIVVVNNNDNVGLKCVVDSYPDSNISIWFNKTILEQTTQNKRLTLYMKNVECSNAGVYTCTGGNEYNYGNMARAYLTLFVKCKPRPSAVFRPIQIVKLALSMPATLTFIATPYLDPGETSFIWMRQRGLNLIPLDDNKNIIITTSGLQSSLLILSATHNDSGEYILIYNNSIGSSNFTFKVLAASMPRPGTVGDSSNQEAFVAVGVGTFVTTLIIVGIVFIVYRQLRRRSTQTKPNHVGETSPNEQIANTNTEDYSNINEYELVQVSKDVEDRTGNIGTTGTRAQTDSSMQYEPIDNSKKEGNHYNQLSTMCESNTDGARETTDQLILHNVKSNSPSVYINMRI